MVNFNIILNKSSILINSTIGFNIYFNSTFQYVYWNRYIDVYYGTVNGVDYSSFFDVYHVYILVNNKISIWVIHSTIYIIYRYWC